MKTLIPLVLSVAATTCVAGAQPVRPSLAPTTRPSTSSDAVTVPDEPIVVDTATIPKAKEVIADVARAYRDTPSFTDRLVWRRSTAGVDTRMVVEITVGPGTDARLQYEGASYLATGDRFYAFRDRVEQKFISAPLNRNVLASMPLIRGAPRRLPVAPLELRYASEERDPTIVLELGQPLRLAPAACRTIEVDGRVIQRVTLLGKISEAWVDVDDETKFLRRILIRQTSPGAKESTGTVQVMEFSPRILEETPVDALTFDPLGREMVGTFGEMALVEGDTVGDFPLHATDGSRFNLTDLRGSITVLYFWDSTCSLCVIGFPPLAEFYDWTRAVAPNVEVLAVNCRERRAVGEKRLDMVATLWGRRNYGFPAVLDPDDDLFDALGLSNRPVVVVLDAAGKIMRIDRKPSVRQGLVEMLQTEVNRLNGRE